MYWQSHSQHVERKAPAKRSIIVKKQRGCTYRTTFCTVKVVETAKTASEKLSLPMTDHRIAGDVNVL